MNKQEWIKRQEKVYTHEGFDEPDRLINNLNTKTESRFEALIEIINRIITKHDNMKQISIADIGCASGAISDYIAGKFEKVFVDAIDLPKVINKILPKNDKVNLMGMDLNKKFPNFLYDIIYAAGTLEHIYNDWFFIENCYSNLKTDGYLIITAPMLETMFGQEDSLHIRIYPAKMLDGLLKLAGFKIERSWEENGRKRIIARKE